jgi:AcrR family transcriptional regulator/D-ribose pyranose/furanose isomerase RbsD
MLVSDKTYLLKQNEALFEATLNEFSSKSYELASTNIIIKNSDYNKGSFYYRFNTKEEIYFALIDYVFTLGISDLNITDVTLNNINKEEELVDLLFMNMKNLWEEDPRYYGLLQRIYLESTATKDNIYMNCIESAQSRITNRLISILKRRSYPYIDIFINSLNSLLYSHFEVFSSIKTELKDIKEFLFKHGTSYKLVSSDAKLNLVNLRGSLNYFISEENVDIVDYDEFRLSKQLSDHQVILANIRRTLKIKQITLANIINAGLKKSLRDLSFFIELKSLNFAETSYHLLEYSQKITLLLVYNSFIGKEYILIDNLISGYSPKEIEILFNLILPKTAKISKIVVVDKTLYPTYIENFYTYILKNEEVKEIYASELVKAANTYLVNYYENDLLKSKIFNKDDEQLITYIKHKKIKNISSNYKLEYKDIKESKG